MSGNMSLINRTKKFYPILVICIVFSFIAVQDTVVNWNKDRIARFYTSLALHQQESQADRKLRLQKYCTNLTAANNLLNRREYIGNYIYSSKAKVVYCYVPKTACTNWKRVFQVFEGRYENVDQVEKGEVHAMAFPTVFKSNKSKKILKTYYSFIFSRHPLIRLFASYRDKFMNPHITYYTYHYHPIILSMFRPSLPESQYNKTQVTFLEFVKYILVEKGYKDHHWAPTHMVCQLCNYNFDYIGKHETLNEDAKYILDSLNLPTKVEFPGNKNDFKRTSSTLAREYYKQIPPHIMDDLYQYYQQDFEAFGYDRYELP